MRYVNRGEVASKRCGYKNCTSFWFKVALFGDPLHEHNGDAA